MLHDLRGQKIRWSREELVAMMARSEFTPQFSIGVWYFSPMGSRFHDRYGHELDIEARLERIAPLRALGVVGVEAHYPAEINEGNLDLWRAFVRDTGIRLVTVIPGLFYDREFEFGALSSPLPAARGLAIQRTITALQMNRDLQTDFAVLWPGIDGYENPLGIDLAAMRARFVEGLVEAMEAVPGVRIAFEPKPYEPRGRILFGTTAEGLLLAQQAEIQLRHPENRRLLDEGHALVALNPEAGHMLMGYEDLAYSLSLACEYGRLAHTHWNSQPLGNFDQDLNVGVIGPEQTEAALYALKMHGYSGLFGIDINPERMPVEFGVRNCIDALRAAADRVDRFDHEKLLWAAAHPDQARGWIEAYLIRQRAPRSDHLGPLPPLPSA